MASPNAVSDYLKRRDLVLRTGRNAVAASGSNPGSSSLWGAMIETAYPEIVATLVALSDGTVSLYFSNGTAIIGAGTHEGPRRESGALLDLAPQFFKDCCATTEYP